MPALFQRFATTLAALLLSSGFALAQSKVTIAIGGASCLCYLPTMLAESLGEFKKAGVEVDVVQFKGGSESLKAVMGGSADVASGYFDHCVNLAAKGQHLQAFVVYDRYPGLALVVSPKHASEIKSVKDLANKKVGVSAPGSSTDFFLKYLLNKNGIDPNSVGVIGVGLGASAIAAMEQGQIDAAVMLDPAVTLLKGNNPDLKILSDTRTQKDTLAVFGGEYPGGALYAKADWVKAHEKEVQGMATAIVTTLKWIHSHSAEEIADKMPPELVGKDKALYIAALRFAPLSLVQATSAGGVGLLAVLVRFGGGRLSRREVLAVAASVGGLLLLGLSLQGGVGQPAAPGWAAPFGWVAVSVLLAVVAAGPGAAVLRPGAGLAVAAGLLYSAGDVATKAAVGGTHPVLLFAALLLACHGLAFVCLQLSFQRGSALATAGSATLLTNAVPILAGLTVFAEPMPGGPAGIARALGFAAAVLGAALLTATGRAGGVGSAPETRAPEPSLARRTDAGT